MRIRYGWLSAGLVALLAATGCDERSRETKAEGAQDSARAQVEQAQEKTEEAFDQAKQAQAQGTGGSGTGEQTVTADVVKASEQELVLGQDGEPSMRLTLNPQTQVTVDGRQARATDIQEGAQVRASYRSENGEQVATRIEAQSATNVQPASPESGESAKPLK